MRGRARFLQPGRGRNISPQGDKPGSGPGGYCVCPKCGYKQQHSRLSPCNQRTCPKCGARMTKQ